MEPRRRQQLPFIPAVAILCFLATLTLLVMVWVEAHFSPVTIEAIVFHMRVPLAGTPPELILTFSLLVALSIAIGLACGFLAALALRRYPSRRGLKYGFHICSFTLLAFALGVVERQYGVLVYVQSSLSNSAFIEDHYMVSRMDRIVFPREKRNVIVIMLESMEETFYDQSLFPEPLIPHLQSLQESNIACTLHKGANLGWTVAGMTGLLLGVPLNLPIEVNSYHSQDATFLPGAISLLEVFERNDYTIAFIAGSDITFAGKRNLFTTHSQQPRIYDLPYFEPQLEEAGISLRSPWGMDDKLMYEQARTIITDMAQEGMPFFTVMLTVDTHNKAVSYGDYPQPYGDERDGFVAADCMVEEFLAWLKEQDFYSNTTILVLGDHTYMNKNLGEVPLETERTIYNAFINTVFSSRMNLRSRQATMLDMGPSLLQSIGVYLPQGRFGLGSSIFSDTLTLTERYGLEELNASLRMRSRLYEAFFRNNFAPVWTNPVPVYADGLGLGTPSGPLYQ